MNQSTTKTTGLIFIMVFSILISITALVLAYARLDVPLSELESSCDRTITIIEMVVGFLGISATVYFITMGITLRDYKEKLEESLMITAEISDDMRNQLHETIFALESIESVAGENEIYIRLAKGRLFCKSKYSNSKEKKNGISYIQAYYSSNRVSSARDEDLAILEGLKDNIELDNDVRDMANDAIVAIRGGSAPQDDSVQRDVGLLKEVREIMRDSIQELKKSMSKRVYLKKRRWNK